MRNGWLALLTVLTVVFVAAACRNRVPYPPAARAEFLAACPGEFWPWGSRPSQEFVDAYCACLLGEFERRWSSERVSQLRARTRTGGFVSLMTGAVVAYPSDFMTLMVRCKTRVEGTAQ